MSAKKDNSIKSTLRYVYLALAVILASSSLFVLTIINQLLNPSLYTNALDKSGFYSVTTSIIEDKATDALLSLEEQLLVRIGIFEGDSENPLLNSLLVWVVGSFLDDATEQLVINVSDDINLKGVIKDASEGVINGGVLWFRGDSPDPEIFAYIPDPERILEIGEASVADVVYVGAIEALGISTLPQCVDDTQINENLQKLARGNLLDLTCTNTTIEPLALAEVEKYIPRESLESAEATIQGFLVMFGLDTVLDQLYQIALGVSVIKQAALGLRDFVRGTIDLSILAYITSFAFLGLGLYVTEKGNKIKVLSDCGSTRKRSKYLSLLWIC